MRLAKAACRPDYEWFRLNVPFFDENIHTFESD
jgi:hypothetical protein